MCARRSRIGTGAIRRCRRYRGSGSGRCSCSGHITRTRRGAGGGGGGGGGSCRGAGSGSVSGLYIVASIGGMTVCRCMSGNSSRGAISRLCMLH